MCGGCRRGASTRRRGLVLHHHSGGMADPMRSSSVQEAGHRPRVADSSSGKATTGSQPAAKADTIQTAGQTAPPAPGNFEYDDNEWDIGIGDLIIDLDADIEKTTVRKVIYFLLNRRSNQVCVGLRPTNTCACVYFNQESVLYLL